MEKLPSFPGSPVEISGGHIIAAPLRQRTVADDVDAAASALAVLPIFESVSVGPKIFEFAATEPEAMLVRLSELPPNFQSKWPAGRYVIPPDIPPGTAPYGNHVEEQIARLFQEGYPGINMKLNVGPGKTGVDIEVPDDDVLKVGTQFAEIKPATASDYKRYLDNVRRWKKPSPVLPITYDRKGNIYYGFPEITEPGGE